MSTLLGKATSSVQTLPPLYLQVIEFILILVLGIAITRGLILPLLRYILQQRTDVKKTVHTLENLVSVAGIIITLVVAFQAAEFGGIATVLTAVTAALTVAVGFGMRETVGNWFAGISIQVENPFLRHDYIKIGEYEGVVKETGLTLTRLETTSGDKLMVPNSLVATTPVRNRTRDRDTRDMLTVTVPAHAYAKAKDTLKSVVSEDTTILDDPSPTVRTIAIEEKTITLQLAFTVRDRTELMDVRTRLLDRFMEEAGDEIYSKPEEPS